jgi:hypothetical protein
MRPYFAGIVRNIAQSVPTIELFANIVLKKFPEAKFVIYENNSTDGTPELLKALESKYSGGTFTVVCEMVDPKVQLTTCKARTWDNKPCRMEIIADARNRLLDVFWSAGPTDEDILVLVDFDIKKIPTVNTLFKYIENFPADADALFANGVNVGDTRYYDMYALRTLDNPVGPEITGEKFWGSLKYFNLAKDGSRIPVISAFGGLGVYRVGSIRGARYSGTMTESLDKLYKTIFAANPALRKVCENRDNRVRDGVMCGVKLFDDILYQNNSGYNFPVICEHSAFHADMILGGHSRLFIATDLVYYSTH